MQASILSPEPSRHYEPDAADAACLIPERLQLESDEDVHNVRQEGKYKTQNTYATFKTSNSISLWTQNTKGSITVG